MLIGFTHAYWEGDRDEQKSTKGYAFNLGIGVFSQENKKKPSIELSTIEVEQKEVIGATCKVVWLQRMFSDLKLPQL